MTSSSCDRVLGGVPELLEKVLLQLPPRDLLLAQRVSKTFRDNIEASTRIQQKLFFKSDPIRARDVTAINPFLVRILNNSDERFDCELLIEDHIDSHRRFAISQMIAAKPYEMHASEYLSTYINPMYAGPPRSPHHSWAKMLVTDPPCAIKICYGSKCEQVGPDPETLIFLPEYTITPLVESIVDLMRAIELLQSRIGQNHS